MIREASVEDIPRLVEMAEAFHALSPYQGVAFDGDSFARSIERYLSDPCWTVKVLDEDGVVGLAIAVVQAFYFNEDEITAQELMWWVDPDSRGGGLRLLYALEGWARDKGAKTLAMGDVPGLRSLESLYRRRGYEPADNLYIRSL